MFNKLKTMNSLFTVVLRVNFNKNRYFDVIILLFLNCYLKGKCWRSCDQNPNPKAISVCYTNQKCKERYECEQNRLPCVKECSTAPSFVHLDENDYGCNQGRYQG
jgi:hypothetical protein